MIRVLFEEDEGVVLMLNNYTDVELVRKALTGGVPGYMLKQLDDAAAALRAKNAPNRETAVPPEYDSYKKEVRDAIQFIHAHYTEKITLDDVAGAINLNRSYLCRLFKQGTGRHMFRYISDLRMRRAASLIEEGGAYVREVAASVGINDQFYFTRVFKKYFGVSPSEYVRIENKQERVD